MADKPKSVKEAVSRYYDLPGSAQGPMQIPAKPVKPDDGEGVAGKIRKLLDWYSDKLTPVAEGILGMTSKPKSIKEAVERYHTLQVKK